MAITIATTFEEAQAAAAQIQDLAPIVVGFDTETTVNDKRESKLVSVITIATADHVFIFQIGRIYTARYTFPSRLEKVIMSDRITKVGVGLSNDVALLCKSFNLLLTGLHGFVDIQYLTQTMRIPESSLNDLCQRFIPGYEGKDPFGHRGDWDGTLDARQIAYAASDAQTSLRLYSIIMRIDICPVAANVDQEDRVHAWIQMQLESATLDRAFDSLVNAIVNSYGPWRNKWIEADRKLKAIEALESFIRQEKWHFDCLSRCFIVNKSTEVAETVPAEEVERVTDFIRNSTLSLKVTSAINKIANSYSGWSKLPLNTRKQWASQAIEELVKRGLIVIRNGIIGEIRV